MIIDPLEISIVELQQYLQAAVAPRPIAFASTIDINGKPNLSPFSFFNVFSSQPPILVFSPSRRIRDATTKHTLENILEIPEVVIAVVTNNLVQQASLSSTEYDKGINEFEKSGCTPLKSTIIRPYLVAESPVNFECKIIEVKSLGNKGGAGNLIICEILKIHIDPNILDQKGIIDPQKIQLVSRLGGNWYAKAFGEALFTVPKPLLKKGIGVDKLPENIRNSPIFTKNDIAMLANIETLPNFNISNDTKIHLQAQKLLANQDITKAWECLKKK